MPDSEEQRLIEKAQAGDEFAFASLVKIFLPNVYSFLARMTDRDTAEDLAQETFVKAWKNIGRFDAGKNFKPWILTIAKNTAFDHIRKKRAKAFSEFETAEGENPFADSLADMSEPQADETAIARETAEELSKALLEIPALYRSVILLRLEENLEFPEIAEVLGRPQETVRSQYRRGISLLRKQLKQSR